MLKKIIIGLAVLTIPLVVYLAASYGQFDTVSFGDAMNRSITTSEEGGSDKVIIVTTVVSADNGTLVGEDGQGARFRVDFTGTKPESPFVTGQIVRFVGHVHGGEEPYFHATQVYGK